jgi:hypothetical protein
VAVPGQGHGSVRHPAEIGPIIAGEVADEASDRGGAAAEIPRPAQAEGILVGVEEPFTCRASRV